MNSIKTCLVYRTHVWNPVVERNFLKLKGELSEFIDVYLSTDHLDISTDHAFNAWQTKYRHLVEHRNITAAYGGSIQMSNPELAIMDFHDKFPDYGQYFLMENDVFTKGSYRAIFEIIQSYPQEYLAHQIRNSKSDLVLTGEQNCWISKPRGFEGDIVWMANHPLIRFSKNAISIMDREFSSGMYGFCEILIPSILIGKYGLTHFDMYSMGISRYADLNRQAIGKQHYNDIPVDNILHHPIKGYN